MTLFVEIIVPDPTLLDMDYFESESYSEIAKIISDQEEIDPNDLVIVGDGQMTMHPVIAADFLTVIDPFSRFYIAQLFTKTTAFRCFTQEVA